MVKIVEQKQQRALERGDSEVINMVIEETIDQLWSNYDIDRNGTLDFEECTNLFNDFMEEQLFQVDLRQIFGEVNVSKSGAINKKEMIKLIRKAMLN